MPTHNDLWQQLIACNGIETVAFAQANGLGDKFFSKQSLSADYIASLSAKIQLSAKVLKEADAPASIMCTGAKGVLTLSCLDDGTIITVLAKDPDAARQAIFHIESP